MRALYDTLPGLEAGIEQDFVSVVALSLDGSTPSLREEAATLLAGLAIYTKTARAMVLQALNAFKAEKREKARFQKLVKVGCIGGEDRLVCFEGQGVLGNSVASLLVAT